MADPAAWIMYEMVRLIINNTVGTMVGLLRLFAQLTSSLSIVMGSGIGGLVIGLILLGIIGFLLVKFVFSSGKTIMIMIFAGLVLLFLIYLGSSIY